MRDFQCNEENIDYSTRVLFLIPVYRFGHACVRRQGLSMSFGSRLRDTFTDSQVVNRSVIVCFRKLLIIRQIFHLLRIDTSPASQADQKGMVCNTDMQSKDIQTFCKLDSAGEELLKMAITKLGLSARAYDRILKVARTIADIVSAPSIRPEHISEAIQYRSLYRNLWQGG